MISPKYLNEKTKKNLDQINKMNPLGVFKEKYESATKEEREKVDKINQNLRTFIKNKDLEGAQRYLAHLKK